MIQNELVDEVFEDGMHMSELQKKVQSLRPQRRPFKSRFPQAGNYSLSRA